MTQDKMRRMITAIASAATVLLVFLLGYLIYQWVTIGNYNKKIEKCEKEIAELEQQLEDAENDRDFYLSDFYLQWQLEEKDLIQGK